MPHEALHSLSLPADTARITGRDEVSPSLVEDAAGANPSHGATADVAFRLVASDAEYRACVALQIETWGDADIVPASLLQVATRIGGLVAGAFTADQLLVGFVFSLAGVYRGEPAHWSHMLAVRPNVRGAGIGRRLKEFQFAELARRGIARLYWTFDPLQARNAHLNLNRLGARVEDYIVDMYGSTASPLHHGIATDRLIVSCATTPRPETAVSAQANVGSLPLLSLAPQSGEPVLDTTRAFVPETARIEVPVDLDAIATRAPAIASEWRTATRAHFRWALARGFTVDALFRDTDSNRAFYIIRRPPARASSVDAPQAP